MAPIGFPDPKWLELLKASRPQAAAVSVACLLLLLAPSWGFVEPLPGWLKTLAFFAFVLCGLLALFSFLSSAYAFFPLHKWIAHYRKLRLERVATAEYIPHMTPKEREIIGYLLCHNQKTIRAAQDGGHAMPLISRRILILALQPGQIYSQFDTPFVVPDHIWEVLIASKSQFPYSPPRRGPEVHPWRERFY